MGLILDTSVFVTAERRGLSLALILAQLRESSGETDIGLSVVTIAELVHGIQRAKLEVHRQPRQAFVDDLIATVTVHPITVEIAYRAGVLSGQEAGRGNPLPIEDLLIGATALQLGFEVVTENIRHFEKIPGLVVRHPAA